MKRFLLFLLPLFFVSNLFSQNDDWISYGKDKGGGHFSSAVEITPKNVKNLEKAWVHRSGDFHEGANWKKGINSALQTTFQATPILVDETLFYCTPYNRVFALDSETGEEKWVFDPEIEIEGKGILHCRGVSSWKDSLKDENDTCYHRIITTTMDAEIFSIDAKTGKLCNDFGKEGRIDLRFGLGKHDRAHYFSPSPPAIIKDKIIVGGAVADNINIDVPGGVVRAYDARTGVLLWFWDPIAPGKLPIIEDGDIQLYQKGTTNVWSIISVDPELDLIYLPTGNTSPDNFGGYRNGSDYYSSSIVALNSNNGKVVWNFQTVHHDVWDYDVPSQPTFYEFNKEGKKVKALAQTTKTGLVFLLNRETGEPIFPVEEKPVPQGTVEGDYLSKTQPFPTLPKPIASSDFKPWGFTFWDKGYCEKIVKEFRSEGLYTPPSMQGSITYPGANGGSNWGGPAIDHSRKIMIANSMNIASTLTMIPREDCDKATDELARDKVQSKASVVEPNLGTPYCTLRAYGLLSPLGVPCTKPPWGKLTAIDLITGEHLWDVPLGTSKDLAPFPFHWIKGSPNQGGPTSTASGLTFIAATSDYYLRAFNTETGEEIVKFRLPTSGVATPMTYKNKNGKQYVVIAAGGHWAFGSDPGDYLIAFALPD
tara:strand:- start:270 stop:2219 length:1950 start_codon:yes stop_codon:yes gene_type:complete